MRPASAAAARLAEAIDQYVHAQRVDTRLRTIAPLERRVQTALRQMWRQQRRAVLALLAQHRGDFSEAIASDDLSGAITPDPVTVATLQASIEEAFTAGGDHVLADLSIDGAFDITLPDAIAYLEGRAANQIAAVDEVTRRYLHTVLATAATENWSYQKTARAITDRFAAFGAGVPQQHLRSRAELVAVTELGDAYEHAGRMEEARLRADGLELEKAWLTAGDERLCPICAGNETAGWIDATKTFPSGHDGPLGHPACRCTTIRRTAKHSKAQAGQEPAAPPSAPLGPGTHTPRPALRSVGGGGRNTGGGGGGIGGPGWDPVPSQWRNQVARHQQPFVETAARARNLTVAEYDQAIESKMRELLADADPFMRIKPHNLAQVLEDGRFKSQFETGASSGAFDPTRRARLERELLGVSSRSPAETRPVYGYLGNDPFGNTDLEHYGRVAVRFHRDVLDRTTYTFWDSLDLIDPPSYFTGGPRMAPSTMTNPQRSAVPHDAPRYVGDNVAAFELQDILDVDHLDQVWPYVEAQYHGGLTLDDIAEVVLDDTDTGLEDLLNEAGIPWRYA